MRAIQLLLSFLFLCAAASCGGAPADAGNDTDAAVEAAVDTSAQLDTGTPPTTDTRADTGAAVEAGMPTCPLGEIGENCMPAMVPGMTPGEFACAGACGHRFAVWGVNGDGGSVSDIACRLSHGVVVLDLDTHGLFPAGWVPSSGIISAALLPDGSSTGYRWDSDCREATRLNWQAGQNPMTSPGTRPTNGAGRISRAD